MENSLTFIVGLQTLIVGCTFLFLWIRAEGRRTIRIPDLKKEDIWRCPICTYVYVDTTDDQLSTCPQCSSMNTKENDDSAQG